jgi:hypothetical protein
MPEAVRPNEYQGIQLRTLLCVEDNPASLKLIERIVVRRPGLRLLSAINGISGIEMALASRPAVILMDINLPDISRESGHGAYPGHCPERERDRAERRERPGSGLLPLSHQAARDPHVQRRAR